jgi:hypothetical protein
MSIVLCLIVPHLLLSLAMVLPLSYAVYNVAQPLYDSLSRVLSIHLHSIHSQVTPCKNPSTSHYGDGSHLYRI